MNVMKYALLVKDIEKQNKIALLQKIRGWVQAVVFVTLLSFIIWNAIDQSLIGTVTFFSALLIELGYNIFFFASISSLRKNQTFDSSDLIDEARESLNEKYNYHIKSRVILTLFSIAFVILSIAGFVAYGILNPNEEILEISAMIFAGVFVGGVIILAIVDASMQQKFVQKASAELDILDSHFFEVRGMSKVEKKRNIFNVSDSEKMLSYVYPDEKLRKKAGKLVFYVLVLMMLIGVVLGIFAPQALENAAESNYALMFILLAVFLVALVGMVVVLIHYQKSLLDKQKEIFLSDVEKYKFHLELADNYKEQQRFSNIISLATLAVVFVVCVTLALIFNDSEATVAISVVGFLVLCVAIIVETFVLMSKFRKKARVLELKIDEHMKQFEAVEPPVFEDIFEKKEDEQEN